MKLLKRGILVHLVLLMCIFDTYFKSPIITGIHPIENPVKPPAKRLVLIIADGLREESLYGSNKTTLTEMEDVAPYLRSKVLNVEACWGISQTRVPTESRPGHIAITAGIYEDPSAILKGWSENPVEFDTIFNESHHSWTWGSPDIIHLFQKSSKVNGFMYSNQEQDFSGKLSTILLDTWVFDKVEEFFKNFSDSDMHSDKIIYFLHLLGLDTAGHTHKPGSKELKENLRVVDEQIKKLETMINDYYKDNNTVYLFTSDHGMTDWGSHGSGSSHETDTPFIIWGAGISPTKHHIYIEQADLTPLMAILIGVPIPVNSVGTLPLQALKMDEYRKALAAFINAKQIYTQFNSKREEIEANSLNFFYKPFPEVSKQTFENIINVIQTSLNQGDFSYVMEASRSLIKASLGGLIYLHNYYQVFLLSLSIITYFSWICLLIIQLIEPIYNSNLLLQRKIPYFLAEIYIFSIIDFIFFALFFIIYISLYCLAIPFSYYLYTLVALATWWNVIKKSKIWLPVIIHYFSFSRNLLFFLGFSSLYIVGIELLVSSFFYRESLSALLIINALWPYFLSHVNFPLKICWTISCFALAVFPFIVVVGKTFNIFIIFIASLLWILTSFTCLIISNSYSNQKRQYNFIDKRELLVTFIQCMLLTFGIYNLYQIDNTIKNKDGLSWMNQILSWSLSILSVLMIPFGSEKMFQRFVNICMGLLVPFVLLSVSYEPLFLLTFSINIMLGVFIDYVSNGNNYKEFFMIPFRANKTMSTIIIQTSNISLKDFRRCFFMLLYVVLAFFGMGNLNSISSFDPMWVRNFVSVFSPFTMMALILFKVTIPYLILSTILHALNVSLLACIKNLFYILLIFSDFMGVHFLFLVKNTGSWLEIGTSLSNYIIAHAMILFVLLFYQVSKPLTSYYYLLKKNV